MKTIQCVNIEILLSKSTHTHTDEYLYKKKKKLLSTSHHLDIETYKTIQKKKNLNSQPMMISPIPEFIIQLMIHIGVLIHDLVDEFLWLS